MRRPRLTWPAFAAATAFLALAWAAPASAETGGSPVPLPEPPEPAATAAPEPAADSEGSVPAEEAPAAPVEATSTAPPEATSVPPVDATPAPTPESRAPERADGEAAESGTDSTAATTQSNLPPTPRSVGGVTSDSTNAAGGAASDSMKAMQAVADVGRTATESSVRVAEAGASSVVEDVRGETERSFGAARGSLPETPTSDLFGFGAELREALDRTSPLLAELLPPIAEQLRAVSAPDAAPVSGPLERPLSAARTGSVPDPLPGGSGTDWWAHGLNGGAATPYPSEAITRAPVVTAAEASTAVRPTRFSAPTTISAGSTPGSAGGAPLAHSPVDRPAPPPAESPAIASGSAGSIFVPLAALLALLALAAPATFRRLGKVPDFRPPVPFVCALERPG